MLEQVSEADAQSPTTYRTDGPPDLHLEAVDATACLQDLVARFDGRLRRYMASTLSRADTDDAVQDVYARLVRQANRSTPPEFNTTYVFKTAQGVLIDLYRRRRSRDADRHVELDDDLVSDGLTPFEAVRWKQNAELLRAAILSLPREERLVLMLHNIEGERLTYVAHRLGLSRAAVQRLLARALSRCRARLRHSGWYEF
ncbi:RNA polymerase sigma factor [Brevundimonas mediterranea]|uniref:RNA polymerase sigma-70 factor (ECF subfamily) n=1 Tax=Brevundimonas mediterranea TaxID=74329 RepID=A0A7W6A0A6_9CAUL|nr:sigma-70 family RNA polymerase sigma factor [Brevundimonas mediterranea]MBB3870888.1 RNA polymerase sigma-70 factor (ECF subfamily) [Brevundimonas mediterranea]